MYFVFESNVVHVLKCFNVLFLLNAAVSAQASTAVLLIVCNAFLFLLLFEQSKIDDNDPRVAVLYRELDEC